jgi:hypothetical protein
VGIVRHQSKRRLVAAALVIFLPASGAPDAPPHVYDSGVVQVRRLGRELYQTLAPKYQKNILPEPIQVEPMAAPVILPAESGEGGEDARQVKVSVGFIDLINHIAHAKAIDRIQPGYFQLYVINLSHAAEKDAPPEPPNMVDDRYWTDAVMNDQGSYFNQMIGLTVALNLSHHYLGHYTELSSQMLAGKLVPINNLLTQAQWDASVTLATTNAMECGYFTEGSRALFEAIDKMPKRPAWTDFIVPPATDIKKLNQELKDMEDRFLGLKKK